MMTTKFPDIARDACPEASANPLSLVGPSLQTSRVLRRRLVWRLGPTKTLYAFLVILLLPLAASAVRVIEAGAIPFTAFLSKADFDQRYPGKEVGDLSTLEPGWYVIYEHEALSYYFGPVLLESTGQDYLAQLTETVEGAVEQRPTIQDYRLELSYEPSQSSTPSGSANNPPNTQNPSAASGRPQTAPKSGIWSFFKRLFGF